MRLFNYETQRIIEGIDAKEAEQLIENGQAIQLDLPQLDELQQKADAIHDDYEKQVGALKNSDNPLYKNADILKYELDKLEREYREQSAEVEKEYTTWRAKQLDEAKTRAARAVIKVSDEDKTVAEQFASRASLSIAIDGAEALSQIEREINLLTDEQKNGFTVVYS